MKLLIPILTATIAQTAISSAATIDVNNNNLQQTNLVTDNSGNRLALGDAVVAIGHFGNLNDSQINDFSSFVQVGTTYVDFRDSPTGYFQDNVTVDMSSGGADELAIGKSVYIVIGDNTSDITQSNNWLVFKYKDPFQGPPTEGPTAVGLIEQSGTLIKGDFGTYTFDFGEGQVKAYTLVPVPEPSSIALLGLGLVGFTLRRRR